MSDPRINEKIQAKEVRLVGANGAQIGVVSTVKALTIAANADLDLVEVAPNANPPVCKVMNFSKYKYEAAQKARESRKNQSHVVLKEVRFRLKIDNHDYLTKTNHAKKFLEAGDKVKAMIQFRGREQQRPELGLRLLERFAADVAEISSVESAPRQDGRTMVMVLSPLKTKAEAKRAAQEAAAHRQEIREEDLTEKADKKERVEVGDSAKRPRGSGMSQNLGDAFGDGDLDDLLLGGELSKAEKRELAKQRSRGARYTGAAQEEAEQAHNSVGTEKKETAETVKNPSGKSVRKPTASKVQAAESAEEEKNSSVSADKKVVKPKKQAEPGSTNKAADSEK